MLLLTHSHERVRNLYNSIAVVQYACHHENNSTVEPRNSGKFGRPEFFRYCGFFYYFAGSIVKK